MKRGEIWTVAGGPDYAGKPRPAVILQSDAFDATASVTVCAITSDLTEAPLFRLPVDPSRHNGLTAPSRLMADKVTTVRRDKLGVRIGRLDAADLARLNRAIILFLNLTGQ
jgi:mRNA interferase MazF